MRSRNVKIIDHAGPHPVSRHPGGVTLVELVIAGVVLSIGVLGLFKAFAGISATIQYSKARGLAVNLAQEKMQVLKQQTFYKVLTTTQPVYDSAFNPPMPYDGGYYPEETLLEGSITFKRRTLVEIAQEVSGQIQTLSYLSGDTGMKLITVAVTWNQGTDVKSVEIRSVLSNPETIMARSGFTGTIRNSSTMLAINDVMVNVAENVGWRDTTGANGVYNISVPPGNYTLVASAPGYFSQMTAVSVAANTTGVTDFNLVPMSSGSARGIAWINNRLVISQVCARADNVSGFAQEYVEVFNPTTFTWTMAGGVGLKFQRRASQDATKIAIDIDYATAAVAPGGYYLFANTGSVVLFGSTVTADAVWDTTSGGTNDTNFPYFDPATPNVIPVTTDGGGEGAGALELYQVVSGTILDQVGWTGNGSQNPGFYEGAAIPQNIGFQTDEQYLRYSSTAGVSATYGPAYDSGNNSANFAAYAAIINVPGNSATAAKPVVAGVPAVGALVSATDGLSSPITISTPTGSPPYAEFNLTSIATGTWSVFISSSYVMQEITNITIAPSATTRVPNSATGPVWPASGYYSVFLSSDNIEGFVSGRVTNVVNAAISPGIRVSAGAVYVPASTITGNYLLRLTPGSYTITANPPNTVDTLRSYVSRSSQAVDVNLGQVTSNLHFELSQGGQISGFVTRDGSNAVPGVAMAAFDANGVAREQEVSGSDGRFTMIGLATGAYTVEPVLGSGETGFPSISTATVTAGNTIFAGTFTITGAMGSVRGTVKVATETLRTGAFIMVTTGTITTVPTFSTATLTGMPYYTASTYEDGTYNVDVRGSTSTQYRVYCFYTRFVNNTPVMSSMSVANVTVTPGLPTTGVNFSW